MNQTENSIKQTQQYRTVKMELIALFVAALCIVVVFRESVFLDMQTQKLILTQQGCSDISSLGLAPKREASGCSIVARYSPSMLGSDRTILLDDDRFVTLSSAAVLANADTNETLPDTPHQKRAQHILWGAFAALFTVAMMMAYGAYRKNKQQRTKQEGKQS